MDNKIDVVITWVDGSDPEWLKEKAKYVPDFNQVGSFEDKRFEDNMMLKYLFRGIEKNMPWVNHIYFVTCGHYPKWLNLNNDKITLVKHSDFMPEEYLPTFNSNSIILNLHKIPNLSEKFVYFNDDFFVLKEMKEVDFFKKDKPCLMSIEDITVAPNNDVFWKMMLNNLTIINKNFNKKQSKKHNFNKWYNLKYGIRNIYKNFCLRKFSKFAGFYDSHLPAPFLKTTFSEVWDKNYDTLHKTCLSKYRTSNDVTEYTMKYWCYASGNFYPINTDRMGIYTTESSKKTAKIIESNKYKLICINDDGNSSCKEEIIKALNKIYPEKSGFEL